MVVGNIDVTLARGQGKKIDQTKLRKKKKARERKIGGDGWDRRFVCESQGGLGNAGVCLRQVEPCCGMGEHPQCTSDVGESWASRLPSSRVSPV